MLRGVEDLKAGHPSSVPEFFGFENWQQVVEFVRSGEGEELLTFVNLVEARGERQLLWALNKVADEDDCDVCRVNRAQGEGAGMAGGSTHGRLPEEPSKEGARADHIGDRSFGASVDLCGHHESQGHYRGAVVTDAVLEYEIFAA